MASTAAAARAVGGPRGARGARARPRARPRAAAPGGGEDRGGDNPLAIELRSRLVQAELVAERSGERAGGREPWRDVAGAKVLLPPGTPAGIVHLLGGALVGGYPHVCYDRLARALADAGGFVVVATPYEAALDHGAAARECARTFADACGACGGAFGVDAANLPRHVVGHSLGAKLALLAAADRSSSDESGGPGGRVYLCAFTSATAQAQIGLLEQLCEALLRGTPAGAAVPVLAGVARRAAAAAGVEFAPNEEATLRRAGVLGEDPRADVRVCTLGADTLDMSMGLLAALKGTSSEGDASEGTGDPQLGASVSSTILPGLGHLSPVCVRVTPADLGAAAAQAADAAGLGGDGAGSGFAFGDEAAVDAVAFDAINYLKGFAS